MGAYDQFSSKNKDGNGSKRKNRRNGASPGGQSDKAVFTADKAGGHAAIKNLVELSTIPTQIGFI